MLELVVTGGAALFRCFLAASLAFFFFLLKCFPVQKYASHISPFFKRKALFSLDSRLGSSEMPRILQGLTIMIKRRLGLSSYSYKKMKRKHEAIDAIDFTHLDDYDRGIVKTTGRSRAAGRKSGLNASRNTNWVEHAPSDHESNSSEEDWRAISDEDRPWTRIISIFPGICPDYIETLYRDQTKELSGPPTEELLVNAILQVDGYPMKEDTKRRKLMQDKVEKSVRWGVDDNVKRDRRYFSSS